MWAKIRECRWQHVDGHCSLIRYVSLAWSFFQAVPFCYVTLSLLLHNFRVIYRSKKNYLFLAKSWNLFLLLRTDFYIEEILFLLSIYASSVCQLRLTRKYLSRVKTNFILLQTCSRTFLCCSILRSSQFCVLSFISLTVILRN